MRISALIIYFLTLIKALSQSSSYLNSFNFFSNLKSMCIISVYPPMNC
jgi:succinate dehydrogenase/fumarate reductase cytochrome b subunit